jgi:hypothetical protein
MRRTAPKAAESVVRARLLAGAAALSLLPPAIDGAERLAFMPVRATVQPRTELEVQAPARLAISAADLARGSHQPTQSVQIRAYSNSTHGLELELQAPPGMFAQLRIQGPGIDATLPGEGGSIAWRWAQRPGFATPATLDLWLSFALLQSTPAGHQDWPLRITGRPLLQ